MQILSQKQIEKLNNFELQKYSLMVGANARKWKNHFVALLPEIARRGIYKKKFTSITEYAAKVGGVGKKTVEAVFQMEKKLADKPALKELIPTVGINKIRVVASIATQNNQKELAYKVKTMSKGALEEVARNIKKNIKNNVANNVDNSEPENSTVFSQIPPGRNDPALMERNLEREYIGFHMSKENALELRKFKQKLEKQRKQKLDFNEVLAELLKIAKESPKEDPKKCIKKVKAPKTGTNRQLFPHKVPGRYVSAAQKRNLKDTYNGCCAFYGCNKPSTQIHHPDRFVLTKSHSRIVPLCDIHHELAHQGLIGNEEKTPDKWLIRANPSKTDPKYRIDRRVIAHKMGMLNVAFGT